MDKQYEAAITDHPQLGSEQADTDARAPIAPHAEHYVNSFDKKNAAIAHLTSVTRKTLQEAVDRRGSAMLALSGGATPRHYLPTIFAMDLDWSSITLTLTDERWVPPDHQDSNERMIKSLLSGTAAAQAQFVPLWRTDSSPQEAAKRASQTARKNSLEIDCVLLGMGMDGHIASLFAAHPTLNSKEAYWISTPKPPAPNAPYRRISLSPRALLKAHRICLVLMGSAKQEVWRKTWHDSNEHHEWPVRLLNAHDNLLTICLPEAE